VAVWGDFLLGYFVSEEEEDKQNVALTNVDVSSLAAVGGGLSIHGNTVLPSLEFPKLLSVEGNLRIGGSYGADNSLLTTLSMPALLHVGGEWLSISVNSSLASVEMGSLTSVAANLTIIHTNLVGISLPALDSVGSYLSVSSNPDLVSLEMSALTTVGGSLRIAENPNLPQCEACEILEQLGSFTGELSFHGNKPDECSDDCE
jgi:hypothetical protein